MLLSIAAFIANSPRQVPIVQYATKTKIVRERARNSPWLAREINSRTFRSLWWSRADHFDEVVHWDLSLLNLPVELLPTFLPGRHQHVEKYRNGDQNSRLLTPGSPLGRAQSSEVQEKDHQKAVDEHGYGDCDAIRACQRSIGSEGKRSVRYKMLYRGVAAGTMLGLALGPILALFIAMRPEFFAVLYGNQAASSPLI